METLELIKKRLRDLPILNTEAYALIDYCSKPDFSILVLEGMIKNNPNQCGQIFRLANSAFYHRHKPSETLADALVLLGVHTLKQIFFQNFFGSLGKLMNAQAQAMMHGRECAALAEFIARAAGMDSIESSKAHLGGLLHDIGQIILAFYFPGPYEQAQQNSITLGIPSFQGENQVFGVNHQEIGAMICSKWNFPGYLVDIIKNHHQDGSATIPELALPVYCANAFLNKRDGRISQPFEKQLQTFFQLRKKAMPWKKIDEEFGAFLQTSPNP